MILILATLMHGMQAASQDDAARHLKSWIEKLQSDRIDVRAEAERELRRLGKAALPELEKIAKDPDPEVSARSRTLIRFIHIRELLTPHLLGILPGLEDRLSVEGDHTWTEAFLEASAGAPDGDPRHPGVTGLDLVALFPRAFRAAHTSGEKADVCAGVASWRWKVGSARSEEAPPDPKDLEAACTALEPDLIEALSDPDPEVRRTCLVVLAYVKSKASLKRARDLFDLDEDPDVQKEAFRLLKRHGLDSEEAFLGGLKSPRLPTRTLSIRGLMELGSAKALDPVEEIFLGEFDVELRRAAARYLKAQGLRSEAALLRGLASKALVIRQDSIRVLGEIVSHKAYSQISRLYREEKDWDIHRDCLEYFKQVGLEAETDLSLATEDEDIIVRVQAILALGDARSLRAIPRLITLLASSDSRVKGTAETALASIGSKAVAEVRKAVEEGRIQEPLGRAIETSSRDIEVERLLDTGFLKNEDSNGYARGPFKDAGVLGQATTVPILKRMITDESYKWCLAHRHPTQGSYETNMMELAIVALGDHGGDDAIKVLNELLATGDLKALPGMYQETLIALYRLGTLKPLEDRLRDLGQDADRLVKGETDELKGEGCLTLLSRGVILNRLNRREEATREYLGLLDVIDTHKIGSPRLFVLSTACYNLARLSALSGDPRKAILWLGKAVRAGFPDRAWIIADPDLDGIRQEEGYKSLLSEDYYFERRD